MARVRWKLAHERMTEECPSSEAPLRSYLLFKRKRRRERGHGEGGILEEEMIKDVAHTFGRGSHAKNNSTQKVERENLERECWGNKRASSSDANQVAERSN